MMSNTSASMSLSGVGHLKQLTRGMKVSSILSFSLKITLNKCYESLFNSRNISPLIPLIILPLWCMCMHKKLVERDEWDDWERVVKLNQTAIVINHRATFIRWTLLKCRQQSTSPVYSGRSPFLSIVFIFFLLSFISSPLLYPPSTYLPIVYHQYAKIQGRGVGWRQKSEERLYFYFFLALSICVLQLVGALSFVDLCTLNTIRVIDRCPKVNVEHKVFKFVFTTQSQETLYTWTLSSLLTPHF